MCVSHVLRMGIAAPILMNLTDYHTELACYHTLAHIFNTNKPNQLQPASRKAGGVCPLEGT